MLGAGFAVIALAMLGRSAFSPARAASPGDHAQATPVRRWIERTADSLDISLGALDDAIRVDMRDTARIRSAFATSRRHYKRLEAVTEFYAPALAASLNSRRPEVDDDDAPPPSSLAPGGFPALEPYLWPVVRARDAAATRVLVSGMRPVAGRIRQMAGAITPTDAQLIEIARLEVARVMTLGIAGFDTPVTRHAMRESADALDGVRDLFRDDAPTRWPTLAPRCAALDSTFSRASRYLRAHDDFDSFDRLVFIAVYGQPMAQAVNAVRLAARVTPVQFLRAWRADAASVYDANAFDPGAYATANAPRSTPALVVLGGRLFSEPALSGPGTRACASCHVPSRAFTDGLARATRLDGRGPVARHTPTLLNAALSPAQFADVRAPTLEEQVVRVLENPAEMSSSTARAASALAGRAEYQALFRDAYGDRNVDANAVTSRRLRDALAAYVRSLIALDSRFDRAVRGDTALLSAAERRGFNLFTGKAGCGTCHFAPLFNGTTPPLFRSADLEVIGTPVSPLRPTLLDPDSGRGAIDHLPLHLRAFKTPTVRNAVLTAPYMHNGAFRTLDEVLTFYDKGGGAGAGAKIEGQTLSPQPLHLTADERAALKSFMGALSDTVVRR